MENQQHTQTQTEQTDSPQLDALNEYAGLVHTVNEVKRALFSEIDSILADAEQNAVKYYISGVKSAGAKLRKSSRDIKKLIHNPTIKAEMNKIKTGAQALLESTK